MKQLKIKTNNKIAKNGAALKKHLSQ